MASPILAQTYPTFDQTPVLFTQSPAAFSSIFAGARADTRRVVILGDSQETSPGGAGAVYIPRLNYEFFQRYGNSPESPLSTAVGSTGGGAPYAEWMVRLSTANPGPAASRLPATSLPPNIAGGASTSLGGTNINNNQAYGSLVMLQPRADDINPGAAVAGQGPYFDTSQGVYIDIFAAANVSSGEVRCRITPTTTHSPNYFQPTTALANTTLALDQPGPLFRRQRLGPFSLSGRPYFQVELSGTSPTAFTDTIAIDFASAANPAGIVVTTLSVGGYTSTSYLANHAGGTPMVALYQPDVIVLSYGANDAGNGTTPQSFRDHLTTLIAHLRQNIRADLPFIIIADPYRNLPSNQLAYLDQYPGVAYDIALSDPLVCALNSRRLTDALGWNAANAPVFLADGVHPTASASILKAQLEVQTLWDAFGPPSCNADLNQDGAADQGDVDYLINVVAGGLNPAGADPDFNQDGVADQGDVDALINVIAGGDCP